MSAPDDGAYGLRDVVGNPRVLVDTVAPTVLFAVAAVRLSVPAAAAVAVTWCVAVLVLRLVRRESLTLAASGLGGVALGVAVALLSGDAEGFFLPGIVGNLAFGALCVVSVLVRRPALAYTSAAIYRWPMGWYLHPRVRPAYSEVTWLWAAYYLAKGGVQLLLVRQGELAALTTARLVLGWPGLVGLLAVTYAYVSWRLQSLGGPDVQEYRAQQAS